jgi:hypothetical protein
MNYSMPKLVCSALLFSGLLACGGGGGSDPESKNINLQGTTDASINFPIEAATVAFLSRNSDYVLNTSLGTNTLKLTSIFSPTVDRVEPILSDETLKAYLYTEIVVLNNDAPVQDRSIFYYSTTPLQFWGESFEGEPGEFLPPTAATSRSSMPATARIGQSGPLGTWPNGYLDANDNFIEAPDTVRWKLQNASTDTAWLCLENQSQDVDGTYTADRCIRINEAGEILDYQADYKIPGASFEFR